MEKHQIRKSVLGKFKALAIGPVGGVDEFVEGKRGLPLRYMTGMLFPRGQRRSDLGSRNESFSEGDGNEGGAGGEEFSGDEDNPLSMANEELPSSVGISFVIKEGSDFTITVAAASYEFVTENGVPGYKRAPIDSETIKSAALGSKGTPVFGERAVLHQIKRPSSFRSNSIIVTISLVNVQEQKTKNKNNADAIEKRLYQVALQIDNLEGFEPYEAVSRTNTELEEQVLALQYSDSPTYAVGHGASVDWSNRDGEGISRVELSYLPSSIVHRPLFDKLMVTGEGAFQYGEVFKIPRLANVNSPKAAIVEDLFALCDFYDLWVTEQKHLVQGHWKQAEDVLLEEMRRFSSRMRQGVTRLNENDDYWEAFVLANKAMLYQIDQNFRLKVLRNEREKRGERWPLSSDEQVATSNREFPVFEDGKEPSWRPFQLTFFLSSYLGLEDEGSHYRGLVDLIWFSTGGGKTEAYLFLSSYELIRRRLRYPNVELGFGTGVITRYTLRFLTADQFSRTASLACALEKIRIENVDRLGHEPFSVGMYVGKKVSYNKVSNAQTDWNKLVSSPGETHKFQLTECPNCGTALIPEETRFDMHGEIVNFGIKINGPSVEYRCLNQNCMFSHETKIPVRITDEEVYQNPPSFLLGTIDKFAMVPWRERAASIFGRQPGGRVVPPTLVIQDELHLISGPLGTLAGIFEAAFDELIKSYQDEMGLEKTGPKYIASSATVRDSDTQIRRLMGRDAAIFPPRGLRASDSFFATQDKDPNKGRLYIGLMAQSLRSTSAAHWSSGALLQSVRQQASDIGSKEKLDFLWTTLCYCNSKRELGLINAAVNQEILDRMRVSALALGTDPQTVGYLKKEEVSSDGVESIAQTRSSLLVPVTEQGNTDVKDFVPCTNMISVGVDIDRLGLMIVNGQPKTTAEYIQATSRVGRDPVGQGPGLVLTLYSPAKPRDRSHYEHFKAYHQTLYRLVEPTSVTPGSDPALRRALHSALIILLRHGVSSLGSNRSAANFDPDDVMTSNLIDALKGRLFDSYPDKNRDAYERECIERYLAEDIEKWFTWTKRNVVYEAYDRNTNGLLVRFQDSLPRSGVGFKTLQSMRGVDAEIKLDF